MSQTQLLIDTVRALEEAGAGYLLSGSLASSLQGEPRATHDVDIVVEVSREVVDALVRAFGADEYYLDELAANEALVSHSMFNLIDVRTGDKVGFWALTHDPFDRSRFRSSSGRLPAVAAKSRLVTRRVCTNCSTACSTRSTWIAGRRISA